MSRLADAVRRRPWVYRAVRRAGTTGPVRLARSRVLRPTVTVVVPFYNVEDYLADCLDSILGQGFTDFEVLLVDDGSPDGSRAIAERYARRDPRVRLLTRPNGGLGAARNTGVRAARGAFLTFVDSDDLLPADALARLVECARRTGSDIVVGGVERFDSARTWTPDWVVDVQGEPRDAITIEDFLPLLRNLYTWNKLFRRDFWQRQDLWFREGVSYEDQPIITQLFARAGAIDVVPDPVYRYRMRDDQSSISQQTATVQDLRQRIAAWEETRRVLRAEGRDRVYDGWLQTLFDAHFHWYLRSPGIASDDYWDELVAAVRSFTDDASPAIWRATAPARRVLITLALQDRRDDAREFSSRNAFKMEQWPSRVEADGVVLELPFVDDPRLDSALFRYDPEQLHLAHAVENLHWQVRDDGHVVCVLAGWAFVAKVDLALHDARTSVILRNLRTGDERSISSDGRVDHAFPPPLEDQWCDYRPGTFRARLPVSEVMATGRPDDEWGLVLRVEVAGFTVTREISRLVRSGSAGAVPAVGLADGGRLIAAWRFGRSVVLRVDHTGVHVGDLELVGRRLSGRLSGHGADDVEAVVVSGPGGEPVARIGADRRFEVSLPSPGELGAGELATWRVSGRDREGATRALVPTGGSDERAPGAALTIESDRNGALIAAERRLAALADGVTVRDGQVVISGRVVGPGVTTLRVLTGSTKTRSASDAVKLLDGRFEAEVSLRHEVYRFGQRPLPIGEHDLSAEVSVESGDGPASVQEVPLVVSAELGALLPVPITTDRHEGRVVRGPDAITRISLQRPVGSARGQYAQHSFRRAAVTPYAGKLHRGLLVRSYFGELATDSGVSVQDELRRRGSDLPVYWAVQDHSVVVPEGGIPVVINSEEWYRLLASVSYYLDNMYQPDYHRRPDGQVVIETFHGYPFKQMGRPHWERMGFSQALMDSYRRRAAEWSYLVSPATYATPLLRRDFEYAGELLEIGYPRNDVLLSDDADRIRVAVRESLGVRPDQTAVLYAPTFRDYMSRDDNQAVMPSFFDFRRAHRRLGDDTVILIRGHAFNARTKHRVGPLPGTVDVTDYPEVSDLYLAADAAVVDYSSLRFDFGVTGKPMIFHVPDLQRYQDSRGWLFDFEPTAPGPLVTTTDEVVDAVRDLARVRDEFAAAYQTFRDDYLDLDDGRAGARLVDAVFVPRGDA
ncbi:MAG TPA: CDP-glycerol glycerophosphotransferase family protein [Nocardioides sp.]|nr:CDP-glycerol glycerophosphotransferase family protein [Nocardioides sp.]